MSRRQHLPSLTPLLAGIALGLAAIAMLSSFACAAGASTATLATPQDAIATVVQSNGDRFAGACESTRSPEDVGKVCARLIEERGAMQAYLIGRTFSEFSTWVFVDQRDGGWTVTGTAPLNFHDTTMTIPWPR